MPRKPKKPCAYPGCPNLTENRYCEEHAAKANREYDLYVRASDKHKKYGRAWKRIRDSYAREHPLCERCLEEGRVSLMDEVHDVGLALLVFTTSGDYDICKEMLDRMAFEQNYDGSFNFSYDIYIGQLFEDYVRTGAMGWLLWGACYYALVTGDTTYNEMIKKAGDFLISRQITDTKDPRYGLLKGGYGTYDFDDYSYIEGEIEWCSTEHQCSALQGLEGCSLVLNVKKYKEAAELIRDQLYFKLYDAENGRFFQGISAVADSAWALDCTTWAGITAFSILNKECSFACEDAAKNEYLTEEKYIVQSGEQDYYNQRYASSRAFSGFKPYSDRDGGYPSTIYYILSNEMYVGDRRLQKEPHTDMR